MALRYRLAFSFLVLGITAVGCGSGDTSDDSSSGSVGQAKGGNKTGGKGGASAGGSSAGGSSQGGSSVGGSSAGGASQGGASQGGASQGGKGGASAGGASAGGANQGGKAGSGGGSAGAAGGGDKPCNSGADCNDNNECTNDTCAGGKCLNAPKDLPETCANGTKFCKKGVCSDPGCGDGVKQANEECDDGNVNDFDGCSNACKLPKCGDGLVQAGEDCDDKNADEFDGCTSACKKPGTSDGQPFNPGGEGSQGVKLDDKGNLIVDPDGAVTKKTKPLIWVANSGEGTISKVDVDTLQEVGRYCTAPGCAGDPSRTTVGLSGDVVSANRGGRSAARIAADEIDCIDRNGNGVIDTWKGPGPVPAQFQWPAGQAESPDECVLWWTDLNPYGGLVRAAGFDAEIGEKGELSVYVYLGIYDTGKLLRLDASNGQVVKDIGVPGNPYGLVVDKDGSVWIQAGTLVKVDVKNGDAVSQHPAGCMYGITSDAQGRIYTSDHGSGCLRRYDPATGEAQQIDLGVQGGGVAVDQNNHVWTGKPYMARVDASGPQLTLIGYANQGGHGAAIDYKNRPWTIPFLGSYQAFRVNANATGGDGKYLTDVAPVGASNYTYSDMTGFQLVNAASKSGLFRKTFAGCNTTPTTKFTELDLDLLSPPGTVSTISVRVANTQAELPNSPWQKVATLPPDSVPIPLNLTGGVIQVEVAMKSQDLTVTPILSSMSVTMDNCGKE